MEEWRKNVIFELDLVKMGFSLGSTFGIGSGDLGGGSEN